MMESLLRFKMLTSRKLIYLHDEICQMKHKWWTLLTLLVVRNPLRKQRWCSWVPGDFIRGKSITFHTKMFNFLDGFDRIFVQISLKNKDWFSLNKESRSELRWIQWKVISSHFPDELKYLKYKSETLFACLFVCLPKLQIFYQFEVGNSFIP